MLTSKKIVTPKKPLSTLGDIAGLARALAAHGVVRTDDDILELVRHMAGDGWEHAVDVVTGGRVLQSLFLREYRRAEEVVGWAASERPAIPEWIEQDEDAALLDLVLRAEEEVYG